MFLQFLELLDKYNLFKGQFQAWKCMGKVLHVHQWITWPLAIMNIVLYGIFVPLNQSLIKP